MLRFVGIAPPGGQADWTMEWTLRDLVDFFDIEVDTAGDVNGDGYSEVIVGFSTYNYGQGRADLFLGSPTGLSTHTDWSVAWEQEAVEEGGGFGADVGPAGDINGDGYGDVLIGAPYGDDELGKVYLYLGSSSGLQTSYAWTAQGDATPSPDHPSHFGAAAASAGDVNGNGLPDILVGAPGYDDYRGKAYLYLGGEPGPTPTQTPTAEPTPTAAPTPEPTDPPASETAAATPTATATPNASPTPDDEEPPGCTCSSSGAGSVDPAGWMLMVWVMMRGRGVRRGRRDRQRGV